jgi:chromatin remodeling complex protein RSC6
MAEFQKVTKETLNELKSNLHLLLDEKNIIVKSLIFYTMEKENPDSTMKATAIDKKIAKYNKMKDEKDNALMIEFKYQKVNKDRLNELKSELRSLHEEKNRIAKKIIFYTKEKKIPDSTMEATTIDNKITIYNKMKEENDNQRNVLQDQIMKLKEKIPKSTKPCTINCPRTISDKLADVIDVPRGIILTGPQAVKKMWEYIKEHNLYNKDTKQVEVNDVIKDLFNIEDGEIVNFFNMHMFVLKHCITLEYDY